MEIAKVEMVAIEEVTEQIAKEQGIALVDWQLAMVGGGQGDIHLA